MLGDKIVVEKQHKDAANSVVDLMIKNWTPGKIKYAICIAGESGSGKSEISTEIALVLEKNKVVGIITDGDVRRILEKHKDPLDLNLNKLIKKTPIVVDHNMLATDAIRLMNKNKITNLIVVKKNSYLGMLHIHAILKAGV